MSENAETASRSAAPLPWQKWIIVVIGLIVIFHSMLITLWLSPSNPIRHAAGTSHLSTYVDPYFQQSWSAYDPTAQIIDETFRIRADIRVLKTDKKRTTRWFDLSASEDKSLRFDAEAGRAHISGRRLATNLNAAMLALNPDQRKLVQDNYGSKPISELGVKLNKAGGSPAAVRTYLAYNQMAVQYASMYAQAKWDGRVVGIQYLVGRRAVPPFEDRDKKSLKDVDFEYFTFGWRSAFSAHVDAQSAFDDYVKG